METVQPDPHRSTLAYDCAGYLQMQVRNKGRGTTFAYDCVKRLTVAASPTQPTISTFATETQPVEARPVGVVTTSGLDSSGKRLVIVAHPHPLVARCLRGEQEAWSELWTTYDAVAAKLVQHLVVRASFEICCVEDIRSEVFMRLRKNGCAGLSSFRGSSDRELRAWLASLAHNVAINYLDRSIRARRRDRRVRKLLEPSDRSGPTEQDVAASLADLARTAPAWDIARMRLICGLSGGAVTTLTATSIFDVSARTHRRWIAELYEKYRKLL